MTSTTPVCDADSATDGIQDISDDKIAQCTACRKDGRHFIFQKNYIAKYITCFEEGIIFDMLFLLYLRRGYIRGRNNGWEMP